MDFRDVVVLTGATGATFGPPNSLGGLTTPGGHIEDTQIADPNGDGDPEIIAAAGAAWVMVGGPGASFATPDDFAVGGAAGSVASGDFDQDGTWIWRSAA